MVESDAAGIRANWNTRWRSDFGAILAGAFVTVGVGLTLLSLGSALEVLSPDVLARGDIRALLREGGGWVVVSIVLGTLVGAYASVRLSAHYGRREAACQGLCSWAVAFVGSMVLAAGMGALSAPYGAAVPGEGVIGALPILEAPPVADVDPAAAEVGAGGSWGFFGAAFLAALAGAVGGLWGLPAAARSPGDREGLGAPMEPIDV
jgi:hypothetical protein